MLHWGNTLGFFHLLAPICVYAMLIFYYCIQIFLCSNICSLHVTGPVFYTTPHKQGELILSHFKLVNKGFRYQSLNKIC